MPDTRKYIHVDTATQSVTAFEDDRPVLAARCSSGGKSTKTPLGEFQTYHKGASIHMTNDGAAGAGRGYDLPGVPWVSFFTSTGRFVPRDLLAQRLRHAAKPWLREPAAGGRQVPVSLDQSRRPRGYGLSARAGHGHAGGDRFIQRLSAASDVRSAAQVIPREGIMSHSVIPV